MCREMLSGSSLWSGFSENIHQKPPLVIFVAGLCGFIIALLGISFYIEDNKDLIVNTDVKDWKTFFSTISDFEMCIPTKSDNAQIWSPLSKKDWNQNQTITCEIDINLGNGDFDFNYTLHGHIPAKYLGHKRDLSFIDMMLFREPETQKFCALFLFPPHLMPNSPVAPRTCKFPKMIASLDVIIVNPWMVKNDNWCSDGTERHLSVSSDKELTAYLSKTDVTLIQLHILYMTSVLLVLVLLMLLYFICSRRHVPSLTVSSDKLQNVFSQKSNYKPLSSEHDLAKC